MKTKTKAPRPFEFVLDELEDLDPMTKPMFGALAVYVRDAIVLILRDRPKSPRDNGVWLATTAEHHASLKRDFPSMRSIEVFGPGPTGWQVLPSDAADFEEAALKACELIKKSDPRIGKIPKPRKPKKSESRSKKSIRSK
jgi:hypothetical protein